MVRPQEHSECNWRSSAEGTDDQIHDADVADVLRVDAQGSYFSFSINDQLVSQVTDADYATGEIGFYVQTFDAATVHIHFDELTISNFEPSLVCKITAQTLHREKRTWHGLSIFQLFVQW